MSQHKKIVEKIHASFSRQDWRELFSFMTDDIERHEVGSPERTKGKEAFERNMKPGPDVASMRFNLTRMTEEGSVVVSEGTVLLTKKDGSSMNVQFCDIFEFDGEKVRRLTSFAGVEPSPA